MREKRQTHWISRRTPLNNEVKTEPDNIKKPENNIIAKGER
jgi:hypothetical protein